ncbi:dockerin type I repeat-containing protein [uncultured Ruminococcus sp.]|uniref:dockerin type I repeat-containing protein n=1 Tax=uncultured Ruminococcus sp. TaxID=165186 RepID=UPI00293016A8|nr:dockerin type I repeat-containing protein [uncultured Ruminococcus sp.]
MFKKLLSVLLAVMMVVSVMAVGVVNTAAATTDDFTPESTKLYFDTEGSGWEMGTRNKVAFHIFGGDLENGLQWGASKSIGTATEGQPGVFEIDPVNGKQGYTLNPGVQYKIIFVRTEGKNWTNQTYDLLFTTDCFGHVAYSDGSTYENPVDSSKKTTAAFWKDMDATKYGPVLQISSIGNVVGTCPEAGKTPESIFTDFLTVVDSVTGTTTYANAYHYMVESDRKTDQQLIDDIGAGLGLNKDQVKAAFEANTEDSAGNPVTTTWSYDASTLPAGETPHTHTPGEPVQENVVPASCTAEGSYDEVVYCTECGEEISREQKTIDKIAHNPGEAVQENIVPASCTAEGSYDEVVYCTECQAELSREHKTIDKLAHTPGEPVQENVVPASCSAEGSYEEVVYCTECNEELSREAKTIDKLPHTPGGEVIENREVTHDYTQYEVVHYCTECNTELSRETVQEPIITHTPGEAVRENEVPATCTAEGSYDEVVYCTSCGAELSRTTKTIDKIAHSLSFKPGKQATEEAEGWKSHFVCSVCKKYFNNSSGEMELTWDQIVIPKLAHTHTPGEAVQENVVPASCKAEGSYDEVIYCTSCGEELSREHKTIDKLAHTPGEAVQENIVPATCTAEGSYDEVVYCTECGEEISREHKTIDMAKHTIKIKPGRAATTEADGWKTHFYCTECGKLFTNFSGTNETTWENVRIPRIVTGKLGDVDGDGEVTVLDVTCLQRVLANVKTADDTINKLGDVDGDGELTTIDTTKLQRWLLGLSQDLKIGEDV